MFSVFEFKSIKTQDIISHDGFSGRKALILWAKKVCRLLPVTEGGMQDACLSDQALNSKRKPSTTDIAEECKLSTGALDVMCLTLISRMIQFAA